MLVDRYASLRHYSDHIDPVWEQLALRGLCGGAYAPLDGLPWGSALPYVRGASRASERPIIVASYVDARHLPRRRVIYVEHGAGQSYDGEPGALGRGGYSGADGLDHVVLFVCPAERIAERWRERYPNTPTAVVGCPRLDRYHRLDGGGRRIPGDPSGRSDTLTAAVTFHWEANLCPEARGAWSHYDDFLPELARWASSVGVRLLGHGHPRIWSRLARRWAQIGVEPVEQLNEVLDRAHVLIADNTSAMYEFASLDRPVLTLNAPWYRRNVEHGLRFWSHVPGLSIDGPHEMIEGLLTAFHDAPPLRQKRHDAVAYTYAHVDGHAAERAADAIVEAINGG